MIADRLVELVTLRELTEKERNANDVGLTDAQTTD